MQAAHGFLGVQVTSDERSGTLTIEQEACIASIFERYACQNVRNPLLPLPPSVGFSKRRTGNGGALHMLVNQTENDCGKLAKAKRHNGTVSCRLKSMPSDTPVIDNY